MDTIIFQEIRGEITVSLRNGIKSGLGEVAQGDREAPGRGAAVISSGHHQGTSWAQGLR